MGTCAQKTPYIASMGHFQESHLVKDHISGRNFPTAPDSA